MDCNQSIKGSKPKALQKASNFSRGKATRQSLWEEICKVVLCWHISQIDLSWWEYLPDIMVMHLNVLCASMKNWIPCNCQCALTASEDGGGRWLSNTQISHKPLSHTHSIVAMTVALYSASQLEVATAGWFLLSYEIHTLPSVKHKPLVDTCVS